MSRVLKARLEVLPLTRGLLKPSAANTTVRAVSPPSHENENAHHIGKQRHGEYW